MPHLAQPEIAMTPHDTDNLLSRCLGDTLQGATLPMIVLTLIAAGVIAALARYAF